MSPKKGPISQVASPAHSGGPNLDRCLSPRLRTAGAINAAGQVVLGVFPVRALEFEFVLG